MKKVIEGILIELMVSKYTPLKLSFEASYGRSRAAWVIITILACVYCYSFL